MGRGNRQRRSSGNGDVHLHRPLAHGQRIYTPTSSGIAAVEITDAG
ncbi:hypothetical protein [Streptomyces sp. 6N223]